MNIFSFIYVTKTLMIHQFPFRSLLSDADRFSKKKKIMLISQVLIARFKVSGKIFISDASNYAFSCIWCGGKSVRTTYRLMCFCTAVDSPYLLFFLQFTLDLSFFFFCLVIFDLRLGNFLDRANIIWDNSQFRYITSLHSSVPIKFVFLFFGFSTRTSITFSFA